MVDVQLQAAQAGTGAAEDQIRRFHDEKNLPGSNHDRFMDWRREHSQGFYLTIKSKQRANLHAADCWHQGDYKYGDHLDWGSATKTSKICAGTQERLCEWVKSQGIVVHRGESCL
jgi:hypothetical protein